MTSGVLAEKQQQQRIGRRGYAVPAAQPRLRSSELFDRQESLSGNGERNAAMATASSSAAELPASLPLPAPVLGRRCLARLSDEEMVEVARGGDMRAVELLLRRHNGLLHRVIQRFRIPGYEYSDLEQLGRIGLLRAIEQFDAGQGCRFSTLATLCILSPLNHAWTSASRKARGGDSPGEVSLDALLPISVDGEAMDLLSLQRDDRTPGPERVAIKRDECRRMVAAIGAQVTHPLAPLVMERLALGDGLAEIGRQVGVSRQALEQLVRRMRRAAEREVGMEA